MKRLDMTKLLDLLPLRGPCAVRVIIRAAAIPGDRVKRIRGDAASKSIRDLTGFLCGQFVASIVLVAYVIVDSWLPLTEFLVRRFGSHSPGALAAFWFIVGGNQIAYWGRYWYHVYWELKKYRNGETPPLRGAA